MKKFRNQKGYSLVELLTVICVILLLIAIGAPVYRGVRRQAEQTAFEANKNRIAQAATMFTLDHPRTATNWTPFSGQEAVPGTHPVHDQWQNYIERWPVLDKSRMDRSFSVEIGVDGSVRVSPEEYEY